MSVTVSYFQCKKCDIVFKGEYKPQQRPRKSCPNCHKMCDIYVKKDNGTPPPVTQKQFETLDEATIEHLILDLLNEEVTESRIKIAVDFHNRVKGTDVINMEEPLDMTGFLLHEQSERKKESSPTVYEAD